MKLATLKPSAAGDSSRDGRLAAISTDGQRAAPAPADQFPTLLSAVERWSEAEPALRSLMDTLDAGGCPDAVAVSPDIFMAPLPRTFAWLDGSAFIEHVLRVRKARGAEAPPDLLTVPLIYQGVSDNLLGPYDNIRLDDESYGLDLEGEFAIVTDEVPQGTSAPDAAKHIILILLMNDISLRNLIPRELATGFGFFHGKPASAFAPFAVTPEELGGYFRNGRIFLDIECSINGERIGNPNGGEMHFSFFQLIEHAAKTRTLSAGTILGSGTVSNRDESRGVSCLAEKRVLEQINLGAPKTPFLIYGDTVEIDVRTNGTSVFGPIRQKVVRT